MTANEENSSRELSLDELALFCRCFLDFDPVAFGAAFERNLESLPILSESDLDRAKREVVEPLLTDLLEKLKQNITDSLSTDALDSALSFARTDAGTAMANAGPDMRAHVMEELGSMRGAFEKAWSAWIDKQIG